VGVVEHAAKLIIRVEAIAKLARYLIFIGILLLKNGTY
jgi:hypothetical protein